jgi:hypothetical protein
MLHRVLAVCLAVLISLAVGLEAGAATKKKKKATPAAPAVVKPIYDAPMRVVIVQASGRLCKDECPQWIAAEGEITAATPGQFAKVFKQLGKRKLPVLIRSPGGSISHAMEVGRMIRKRGLDVAVGFTLYEGCAPDQKSCKLPDSQSGTYRGLALEYNAWCNSACHLVLAGGTRRLAGLGTYVGVHKPRTVWTREIVTYRERYKIVKGKKKVIDRKIVSRKPAKSKVTYGLYKGLRREVSGYYREMGIDLGLVAENEKAEFKDINNLTKDQLDKYRLRTSAGGVAMLVGNEICKTTPKPGNCVALPGKSKAELGKDKEEQAARLTALGISSGDPSMTFTLARSDNTTCESACPTWIAAEGVITERTPQDFRTFWNGIKYYRLIVALDSKGGNLQAAQELAREFRKRQFNTAIAKTRALPDALAWGAIGGVFPISATVESGATCSGACLVAYAGGLERHAPEAASMKLVNAYALRERPENNLTGLAWTMADMGVSPAFMSLLHDIKKDETKVMGSGELISLHLSTDSQKLSEVFSASRCGESLTRPGCATAAIYPGQFEPIGQRHEKMSFEYLTWIRPECSPNCPGWIAARGRIVPGTTEVFEEVVKSIGHRPLVVMLDSPGGNAREAMKLAKAFRRQRVDTMLGISSTKVCVDKSAPCQRQKLPYADRKEVALCQFECGLAFVGGKRRILATADTISLPGFQLPELPIEGELDPSVEQSEFYATLGFERRLAEELLTVSRGLQRTFDSKAALAFDIATTVEPASAALLLPSTCKNTSTNGYCLAQH